MAISGRGLWQWPGRVRPAMDTSHLPPRSGGDTVWCYQAHDSPATCRWMAYHGVSQQQCSTVMRTASEDTKRVLHVDFWRISILNEHVIHLITMVSGEKSSRVAFGVFDKIRDAETGKKCRMPMIPVDFWNLAEISKTKRSFCTPPPRIFDRVVFASLPDPPQSPPLVEAIPVTRFSSYRMLYDEHFIIFT